jgi:hypothetical protein
MTPIGSNQCDYVHKLVILARSIASAVAFELIFAGSVAKEVALERDGLGWRLAHWLVRVLPRRARLATAVYIDIDARYGAGGIQEGARRSVIRRWCTW